MAQTFSVTIDQTPAAVDGSQLPDSSTTMLPSDQPSIVDISITNSGATPEQYFVDGRLDGTTQLHLVSSTGASTSLPNTTAAPSPQYLVPSHTTSITVHASAPKPIVLNFAWAFGDPDLLSSGSSTTNNPTARFDSSPVTSGVWDIQPTLVGPNGESPMRPVIAQTSIIATTEAFDQGITAATGDLWPRSVDPTASLTPVEVEPGKTVVIPVTITPSSPSGTVITGVLYVDDFSPTDGDFSSNANSGLVSDGSELAALPYQYKVS